jgi:hypothetical protein
MAKWKKTIDMAIANHLDAHVMGASFYLTALALGLLTVTLLEGGYEFLMEQCAFFEKIVEIALLILVVVRPRRRQDMHFRIFTWRIHCSRAGRDDSQSMFLSLSHVYI